MQTTRWASPRRMPRTPVAWRPIGRTSPSSKRTALPSEGNNMTSYLPYVGAPRPTQSPASAAALRAVIGERLAFHVAAVREGDHHVLRCDQVLDREVLGDGDDLALPLVAKGFLQRSELLADDLRGARRLRQDIEQIGD